MKTHNTLLNNSLVLALVLTVVLACGFSQAADPVVKTTVINAVPVNVNVEAGPVVQVRHEIKIVSEDGIPLAREDVIPLKTAITGGNVAPEADLSQAKISSRATDAKMQGFLARTSLQQLASVYRELSQMVDQRHVDPPAYETRTRNAVQGVINALNNQHFLQVNRANVSAQSIQSVQSQLMQMVQAQPARDVNGAVAMMQNTAEIVNRGTGIRREAVGLEFLNSTMDSLDKYSAFLPETAGATPGAMIDLVQTAGLDENLVGIGVELKGHAQGVELVGVIENSPAAQLGLQEGDLIVAVNGQNMAGKTLNEVADKLAGSAGTSVTLEILRNGQRFRGTATRRSFYVSSVTGTKMIDTVNGTGYIRLKQFSESSAEDLEKALFTLHNQGMKSLIFDLRGNPGGLLDECVDISDMFLPRGTIVSTKGRNASDNTVETATQPKTWSVPLVVLVDDNSASASEIFAAAIQENQRGVIVGRTSYGKGTVQTHFPMKSVSAILKLTTAKFYSPNGREMAGSGVTPDVAVAAVEGSRISNNDNDVQTARQVFANGVPSQMVAVLSGKAVTAPTYNYGTSPVVNPGFNYGNPLTSTQPVRQYPAGVREQ
ncbi:S41 family peptidase [Planctomicrobium sp. SH661]|uniref:S41 family peptidase n=1 Tax=Planctomicrobium sp. SH661 TaxID=3448124 RepID=UPI003F5BB776